MTGMFMWIIKEKVVIKMTYKNIDDLPKYGEQDVDYENPFQSYTPCKDSILQEMEDEVYESVEQALCEINGFEKLASYDKIPLHMDSWIFISNPIYQSDRKNHLKYVSIKNDDSLDDVIADIKKKGGGNWDLTDGNWLMEEHNGYILYVNKQDWADFVKSRKNRMSKYVNGLLGRTLELKDVIHICKKCDYCDVVYFYNEETKEYDERYLSCSNCNKDCEYQKYWE